MPEEHHWTGGVLARELEALPCGGAYSWYDLLSEELAGDPAHYASLDAAITAAYAAGGVNPAPENLLRAFRECPLEKTSVVICGQDPYPNREHAMGLAFSVPSGAKQAQSLRNILRELESDVGGSAEAKSGDLSCWARQGVLLLNTSLTVEEGRPNSHQTLWRGFAASLLARLNVRREGPLVYLLWGGQAAALGGRLRAVPAPGPRAFLCSAHPSPLSAYRGFFGSRPFSRANDFLRENGAAEILW